MEKINFYNYITNFNYSNFFKKQLIYAVNPIKHFNDVILNDDKSHDDYNNKELEVVPDFLIDYLKKVTISEYEILNNSFSSNYEYTRNLCIIPTSGLMLKKMRAL